MPFRSGLNDVKIEESSLKEWFKFQKEDGSFSTYKNEKYLLSSLNDKNIKNAKGWVSTHHCVSAVSLFVLLQIKIEALGIKKTITFFEKQDLTKIISYWWTSPIYTYYYLAKSYLLLGKENQLKLIIIELRKHQNKDGSFSDKYGVNLFYSGLALEVYLLDYINFNNEANMASKYLLNHQFDNGSWKNSNALQVPDSSDTIPKNTKYPISKKGMNVRAKEFNRLFTTATILKSLALYEKRTTSSENF